MPMSEPSSAPQHDPAGWPPGEGWPEQPAARRIALLLEMASDLNTRLGWVIEQLYLAGVDAEEYLIAQMAAEEDGEGA